MAEEKRKTGIDIIGDVPWGTHFCQFYKTKEDLLSVLVPYFKAGLENNEFCMWICWDPLRAEEARASLSKSLRNLDDYIKKGQIEIVDYSPQQTEKEGSSFTKMKQFWIDKERQALERGFEGLRLAGNTYWLEKREWNDFKKHEEEVNDIIRSHKMLALCPYSLDKCGPSEIIDVTSNHKFAMIIREGKWEIIESCKYKKAEDELRENERRFRELFENMRNGGFVYKVIKNGKDFIIKDFNKAGRKMTKLEKQNVIGKSIFQVFPKIEETGLIDVFKEVWRTGKSSQYPITQYKDERIVVWAETYIYKLPSSEIVVVVDEITERKKAEEKIEESAKEWQRTFNSITDLIFIQNNDRTILKANKAFADVLKVKPEDIVGKKCYELLHKSDKPWQECPFGRTQKDKKAHVQEIDDPNIGTPLLVTTAPIFDDKRELVGCVHIAKDITEMKVAREKQAKAYIELRSVQAQLVQTSKLATLGEMSAGLAHEINQPLCGIALTAKKLRKLTDRNSLTDEEAKAALRDIESSVERIAKIIQHVRIFARQDTFKFTQLNVNETIEGTLSLLNEQLRLHEIAVIKEYSDNLPPISGEPYQLEQVIINIITNARDALDEKDQENIEGYSKKLVFKTEKIKDEVCISISDNGMGMTEEVKGNMFQPFFTTKEVGKATGLGMSTSYGIIKSHKGRIEVESAKNAGTTIKVFLPISMVTDN